MASIKHSLLALFVLFIVEKSSGRQPDALSGPIQLTVDVVDKMIKCLEGKGIQACKNKPDMRYVKACADSSVESVDKISQEALDQIFTKLFQVKDVITPFQTSFFKMMNQYISEGYTIQRLSTLTLEQIIYGTKRFTLVGQNEYFDIYCSFKETVGVAQKLLESVQSNYHDLKSSVEIDTLNSGETMDLNVKAYNAKNSLLTSIIESYAGVKFVFKPLLSSFIHILLIFHIKERDKIQYAIHDVIQKILEETDTFTNQERDSQSLRTKIERDKSFEVLVLEELTCYHIHLQNTARLWILIATVLNILFVVVVILFGIRYLVFYIRARNYVIRQSQPILTYQEATGRSID